MVGSGPAIAGYVDGGEQGAVRAEIESTKRGEAEPGIAHEGRGTGRRVHCEEGGEARARPGVHGARDWIDRQRGDDTGSHVPDDGAGSGDWVDGDQVAPGRIGPEERAPPRDGVGRGQNQKRAENGGECRQFTHSHQGHLLPHSSPGALWRVAYYSEGAKSRALVRVGAELPAFGPLWTSQWKWSAEPPGSRRERRDC